ncbi:MAG: GAF domain-containing protein [Chloroflexi bacterium]|nr:GAF domain-containing protein [Chloroflexota bacterium]
MQDALAYLASLRTIIRELPSLAAQVSSLEQFIETAFQIAEAEWHSFTNHRLISQTSPANREIRPDAEVWTLPFNLNGLALELTVPANQPSNEALWETMQLWSQFVTQQWQNRQAMSSLTSQNDADSFLTERLELLEGLSQVAQRVSAELASEGVLIAACQSIVESLKGIDHVGIVINDHAPEYGTVLAEYPITGAIGQKIQLAGYVVYDKQKETLAPFVIDNVAKAVEELGPNRETLMAFGIKSVMILPLFVHDEYLGSLGLDALKQEHKFTPAEIEILTAIAAQIAISIQNAQLFEEAQRNARYQSFINSITAKFQGISDVETVLSTTLGELSRILGADRGFIRIVPAAVDEPAGPPSPANMRANDDEWVEM